MKTYITNWKVGEQKGTYKTKSLTPHHRKLHENCDEAITLMTDTSVQWLFGLWTEVIAKSSKLKPNKNQPFNI